ncbi:hypothetical protein SAMN05216389_10975 [Oceanobacillus limi]|uniref:Cell-wall binding lipoprotein n=1 Tax=Oceanobacillus limi TaxID=930131 RepID=A0A1I0DQ69_9BACI|nr:hypothetical protein [Oceanobacillus limi]SET34322.1 hypothetical protein SAMN05216389_10975 [Oceanobacillus limi]
MKKLFVLCLFILMTLVACSSPETDELVEYHNNYIDVINEKAELVDQAVFKSMNVETPEEALEIQKNEVMPLVNEIKDFMNSQEVETEAVKEFHDLRMEQIEAFASSVELQYEALEKTVDMASKEQINKLVEESDAKYTEAMEKSQKAEDRLAELADEYDVEFMDEE